MMRGFLAPVGKPTVKEYKIICPKVSSGTVIKKTSRPK